MDFGEFWGGFWEGFGRSLASLGLLLSLFCQGFVAKRAQEGPRGGQEVSWARFGKVLDGFWEAKMVIFEFADVYVDTCFL